MKAILYTLGLLLGLMQASLAQNGETFAKRNTVQLELGGHGFAYSINYERFLLNRPCLKTSVQVGASYYPPSTGTRDLWFPVMVNQLFSLRAHHLEAGGGLVLLRETGRDADNAASGWFWSNLVGLRLGYRYQAPNSPWLLRVGFTPFIEADFLSGQGSGEFIPFGGLAVGYSF
jgi:hypothetical protein